LTYNLTRPKYKEYFSRRKASRVILRLKEGVIGERDRNWSELDRPLIVTQEKRDSQFYQRFSHRCPPSGRDRASFMGDSGLISMWNKSAEEKQWQDFILWQSRILPYGKKLNCDI